MMVVMMIIIIITIMMILMMVMVVVMLMMWQPTEQEFVTQYCVVSHTLKNSEFISMPLLI